MALYTFEYDVFDARRVDEGTLERVGDDKSEGSCGSVHEASCHTLVFGGPKTQTMMQDTHR
jgi:hypothetical protein